MTHLTLSARISFAALLLAQLMVFSVFGQMNSDALNRTMDSLFFQTERVEQPGFSVAIVKDNSVIYQRSTGQINVEKKIPFTGDSRIAIASCSKQFTAFGVLLLKEAGQLKLSDDIRKHIPELPDFGSTVTIKHLLSHTSGIRDHITLLGWENNQRSKFYDFEGTIEALQKYNGLSFRPGDNFAYSNTGYVLLAILIERVSGVSLNTYMQEKVFKPLGMNETEFCFKRDYRRFGFSRPYNYNEKKEKFITYRNQEVNAMGAVGVYTTMNDFIKWDQNFTSKLVGSNELFDHFLTSDTLNNGLAVNYNNGLKERYVKGYHVVEHSGGWAYYNFQYTRIPELGVSVIIASNNEFDYPIGMVEKYINEMIPDNRNAMAATRNDEGHALKFGNYLSDNFTLRTIEPKGGSIKITGPHLYGAKSYELVKLSNDTYLDSTDTKLFPNNSTRSFRWAGGGYFMVPTEFHLLSKDTLDFKKIEGNYENSELGTIRIKYNIKKGTIKLKTSFGKKPKIKEMKSGYFDLDRVDYDLLLIDNNTLIIGNSMVFNLGFIRK